MIINWISSKLKHYFYFHIGILEGREKGRPTEFITGIIPKLLDENNFVKHVKDAGDGKYYSIPA